MAWYGFNPHMVAFRLLLIGVIAVGVIGCLAGGRVRVSPVEDTATVLHNPDMGWVLLENYPLDQKENGSSTLVTLPEENFPELDYVALMFSWSDIETEEGVYDFSRANYAYDYWRARGKRVHLRMGSESFLWWPNSGRGVPRYVLDRMAADEKQTRQAMGLDYTVVDARNAQYRERLGLFLQAVAANFSGERPVELIDLRGFGLWGEWHSGFQYPSVEERRGALCGIIDFFADAFPGHRLALSYSYDPDAPPETWSGTTTEYDSGETDHFGDYVRFSAFDHALTKENVTFRRDGCGGTVHSNERKFAEIAFSCLGKGPFTSEFFDGYRFFNGGDPWWNGERALDDALSLHPNFIVVMGWQTHEARQFVQEKPELVARGLRSMGYRLVPVEVSWPETVRSDQPFAFRSRWVNRGVGRALADYDLGITLKDDTGSTVFEQKAGGLDTSRWVKGNTYKAAFDVPATGLAPGGYDLWISVTDPRTGERIELPLVDGDEGTYRMGMLTVAEGG